MSEKALRLIEGNNRTKKSKLDLSFDSFEEIPEELSQLTHLQTLDLSNSNISNISILQHLSNLQTLNLSSTNVTDISVLKNLFKIQNLYINSTDISDISIVRHLPSIENLYLSNTKISDISVIQYLPRIQVLNLRGTKVSDISVLRMLSRIHTLDLTNSRVSSLLPLLEFIRKGTPVVWDTGIFHKIFVRNCPLKHPSPEIVKQGNKAILNYFREIEEAEKAEQMDELFEAKLLIVGEGGSGKTSLYRKLQNPENKLPIEGETTEGIDIHEYYFNCDACENFRINLWDFGGQEIYYATHRFFLTKRSLYILVTDGRKEDTNFNYWLQIIELLSDKSPVIILQNIKRSDNQGHFRKQEVDLRRLQNRFSNLLGPVFYVDLKNDLEGLERVRREIEHRIQDLPHVGNPLPGIWTRIRKVLEERSKKDSYISVQEYAHICEEEGMKDLEDSSAWERAKHLSKYLHDLGVFLHFQDDAALNQTVILKNEWATDAVYSVLDNPKIKNAFGKFSADEAQEIWNEKRFRGMHLQLLALMRRFELCYQIPDTISPKIYIAPQLLSKQQPAYEWQDNGNLELQYHYEFMPKGILGRLIVRKHRYVRRVEEEAWRYGAIFHRNQTKAEVVETLAPSFLLIRVQGPEPQILMTLIKDEVDAIHDTFPDLQVKKLIPCTCPTCKKRVTRGKKPHFFNYHNLVYRKDRGRTSVECDRSFKMVSVLGLIDAIFTPSPPNPEDDPVETINTVCRIEYLTWLLSNDRLEEYFTELCQVLSEDSESISLIGQFRAYQNKCLKGTLMGEEQLRQKNQLREQGQILQRRLEREIPRIMKKQIPRH